MNADVIARIRARLRVGIDQGSLRPAVAATAALALTGCWFVATRPVVALALFVGALCIVGFVALVGAVGWVLFVWRASSDREVGVVDVEAVADGLVDPIEADDPRLPYGGGWGA